MLKESNLYDALPTWDVYHTGGGIFNGDKNFIALDGSEIMVLVTDNGAMVFHQTDDDSSPFANKQFYDATDECGFNWVDLASYDDELIAYPIMLELFSQEVADEIIASLKTFSDIIWGEVDDEEEETQPDEIEGVKEVYGVYSAESDMTFIMEDVSVDGEPVSSEVKGYYFGKPEEELIQQYYGKTKVNY
jgi:hypothetical protein